MSGSNRALWPEALSLPTQHFQQQDRHAEALMRAGEEPVRGRACAHLRLEVRRDNEPAIRLYRKLGYRLFGTIPHYYEDDQEALRFEKRIRFYSGARSDLFVPYYGQTTPFTCGPACLLMAMRAIDPQAPVDQREELRLWREATTIFMTSGHGGCGPHGLALAAQRRGFNAELFLNDDRVLFIDGLRDERKRQVLGVVHEDYHQQVLAAGIPISYQPLTVEQMATCLARRIVPVVLISSWRLTREKAPHWVVVAAIDSDFVYIHDPDIKTAATTTPSSARLARPLRPMPFVSGVGSRSALNASGWLIVIQPFPATDPVFQNRRGRRSCMLDMKA